MWMLNCSVLNGAGLSVLRPLVRGAARGRDPELKSNMQPGALLALFPTSETFKMRSITHLVGWRNCGERLNVSVEKGPTGLASLGRQVPFRN
ncbi:hypothetical protein RRG08_014398 [Elysia crispata]|uniref:Uncharacterized protein n=1 Tax=Elysia crispata TaxID=231223 RepID=A0AAE0YX52_9GAST|nr:hypothetical protein RRG08_014398 [Elysia crispata]